MNQLVELLPDKLKKVIPKLPAVFLLPILLFGCQEQNSTPTTSPNPKATIVEDSIFDDSVSPTRQLSKEQAANLLDPKFVEGEIEIYKSPTEGKGFLDNFKQEIVTQATKNEDGYRFSVNFAKNDNCELKQIKFGHYVEDSIDSRLEEKNNADKFLDSLLRKHTGDFNKPQKDCLESLKLNLGN